MEFLYVILFLIPITFSTVNRDKKEFCANLKCKNDDSNYVCGMRIEENGVRLRLFKNECALLKYGCSVDEDYAYGIINIDYCKQTFPENVISTNVSNEETKIYTNEENAIDNGCNDINCNDEKPNEICGIREDGAGYRVRQFHNKCELMKYNCDNNLNFLKTDWHICNPADNKNMSTNDTFNIDINEGMKTDINEEIRTEINDDVNNLHNVTNIVVVNSRIFDQNVNMNDSIDSFFAASHVFDLPIKEVQTLDTRRRLIKNAGPVKVFVPWIVIPKNISNDSYHAPTLSSCYHTCPTKCPETYAPVCGVPGIVAREPSLMFQNHCFMDVAQCKMFWEKKSSTAHSSSYVETSFLFCMGDEMNAVYRFLPAIRTLQRMGRLKKKGKFRSKLKNFRFISDFRSGRPKFMG